MARFFASGHAVDLVLLVIALEFALLCWRRKPLLLDGGGVGVFAPGVKKRPQETPPSSEPPNRTPARTLSPALPRSAKGKGSFADPAFALLPGVFMLLALRAALTGAPWPWIAAPLALSFPFHLADLVRRGF